MPLALGGLVDLFERVPVDDAALGADDDPLVRGRAVLDALRQLARERPTVVAIDDVQWLDSASAHAMRYATRRLEAEPIGLLTTVRRGTGGEDRWTPGDALGDAGRILSVAAGIALLTLAIGLPIALLGALGAYGPRVARRRRREAVLG